MNHKGIPLAERAIISEDCSSIDYGSQSYRLNTGSNKRCCGYYVQYYYYLYKGIVRERQSVNSQRQSNVP